MQNKAGLFVGFSLLFILFAGFISVQIIKESTLYKDKKQAYCNGLNYEHRLLDVKEWINPKKGAEKIKAVSHFKTEAQTHLKAAHKFSLFIISGMLIYFICIFLFYKSANSTSIKWRTLAILLIAMFCLIIGVASPMLEIGALERDLVIPLKIDTGLFGVSIDHTAKFSGDMYFYYQCKSILELIQLLLSSGNLLVGISILVFSLLIPAMKLFLTTYLLINSNKNNSVLNRFVQSIGKWSMADVFVVAIFLGFLAFSNMQTGILAESKTLLGLYFFFAYCMLSIGTSYFLNNRSQINV